MVGTDFFGNIDHSVSFFMSITSMIREIPLVANWLAQFNPPHRYLAEYLLAKLRYVSFEEVESWVQTETSNLIAEIVKNEGRSGIAIFPVTKPLFNEFNENKEPKQSADSSGRIAHMLRNLERNLPSYVELCPRTDSMRDRKVKNIIFVDDFIGTGDRFIKSWRQSINRSVKSWSSFGWCKVWILSYAAHESGISRIEREVKAIDKIRVRCQFKIEESFIKKNQNLLYLCLSGGGSAVLPKKPLGYGKLCSPIIFQYGCPNNAPSILWNRDGEKKSIKPLFPNRSVPTDLYSLFGVDHSAESIAEELWLSRQYKMALRFLDDPAAFGSSRAEIAILSYLASGMHLSRLRTVMVMDRKKFDSCLEKLLELGLIDDTCSVTRFGHDVLQRGGRKKRFTHVVPDSYSNYYPSSFLGFQRDV
jgi:hypothetical protein